MEGGAWVKVMYNLEVAQDHTYTVGMGQWVVHNTDCADLLRQAQDLLDVGRTESKGIKAVGSSNIEDPSGDQIIRINGGNKFTQIGGQDAADLINNGKCAEGHCFADGVFALRNGGNLMDGDSVMKFAEQHIAGIGPCLDCQINAAIAAEVTHMPVFLRWVEGLYIFD